MEIIDEGILKRFKEGDHSAFDQIFHSYYNRVKNFIYGLIKSDEDAKEIAQDIFTNLWINRKSIDLNKSFNAYLFISARNLSFNYLKHRTVEKVYINDYLNINKDFDNQTEEFLFAKEINLLIDMTVEKMPIRRKNIYIYSRVKGYSNEEIAEKLHISKKTVENQLSLALKEIRKVIFLFMMLIFYNL